MTICQYKGLQLLMRGFSQVVGSLVQIDGTSLIPKHSKKYRFPSMDTSQTLSQLLRRPGPKSCSRTKKMHFGPGKFVMILSKFLAVNTCYGFMFVLQHILSHKKKIMVNSTNKGNHVVGRIRILTYPLKSSIIHDLDT